jgi:sulfonate transport system permease protein
MNRVLRVADRLNLIGWAVVVAAIALWQLIVVAKLLNFSYLPEPTKVATALGDMIKDGSLGSDLEHTLVTAFVASAIAVAIGVAVGVVMGLFKPAHMLASATVDFLRSVPAVTLMPVALLLFGASSKSEIVVGVFAGVWPVLLNTIAGVQAINPRLHEVGRVLHVSRIRRTFKILIPSAVPAILVGVRLTVVTCLVVVIIAEILINPQGIGWSLSEAQKALRPDVMFAYAVVTGILGYLINVVLVLGVRLCMPGSPALRGRV